MGWYKEGWFSIRTSLIISQYDDDDDDDDIIIINTFLEVSSPKESYLLFFSSNKAKNRRWGCARPHGRSGTKSSGAVINNTNSVSGWCSLLFAVLLSLSLLLLYLTVKT